MFDGCGLCSAGIFCQWWRGSESGKKKSHIVHGLGQQARQKRRGIYLRVYKQNEKELDYIPENLCAERRCSKYLKKKKFPLTRPSWQYERVISHCQTWDTETNQIN